MIPESDGFDKTCSCGERIRFVASPTTGNMIPECAHGNHFLDCPDRMKYRRNFPKKEDAAVPGQKGLDAF